MKAINLGLVLLFACFLGAAAGNLIHLHHVAAPLVYQPYCDTGHGFFLPCAIDALRQWSL